MATPPGSDHRTRKPYEAGMGDPWYQVQREGSDQHLCCISATSLGQAHYPRHHK